MKLLRLLPFLFLCGCVTDGATFGITITLPTMKRDKLPPKEPIKVEVQK